MPCHGHTNELATDWQWMQVNGAAAAGATLKLLTWCVMTSLFEHVWHLKSSLFNPNSYLSFLQSIKCYFRSVDHFLLPCRVFLISKMMNFKEFLSGPAPAVHLHHAPLFRGIALQLSQSSGNKRPLRPRSIKSRNFIYKLQRLDVSIWARLR